jgi:hypothetical protein
MKAMFLTALLAPVCEELKNVLTYEKWRTRGVS